MRPNYSPKFLLSYCFLFSVFFLSLFIAFISGSVYATGGGVYGQCSDENSEIDVFMSRFGHMGLDSNILRLIFEREFSVSKACVGKSVMPTQTMAGAFEPTNMGTIKQTLMTCSENRNAKFKAALSRFPSLRTMVLADKTLSEVVEVNYLFLHSEGGEALEQVVCSGDINSKFLMGFFKSHAVKFFYPIRKVDQYRNALLYLRDHRGVLDFFADIDMPFDRKGNLEVGKDVCVRVIYMALHQFKVAADRVLISILSAVTSSEKMRRLFYHSPVVFVTMALSRGEHHCQLALVNIHDKNSRSVIDENQLEKKLKKVYEGGGSDLPVLHSLYKSQVRMYWEGGGENTPDVREVASLLLHNTMYQRSLTDILYGMKKPSYSLEDIKDFVSKLNKLQNFLIPPTHVKEKPEKIFLCFLALSEFHPLVGYISGKIKDHYQGDEATVASSFIITALSNSVNPWKDLPGGARNLWHTFFLSVLEEQFSLLEGRAVEPVEAEEQWLEKFISEYVDLGSFSNPRVISAIMREKIRAQFYEDFDKPESDDEWNLFYRAIYQAVLYPDNPELFDKEQLLTVEGLAQERRKIREAKDTRAVEDGIGSVKVETQREGVNKEQMRQQQRSVDQSGVKTAKRRVVKKESGKLKEKPAKKTGFFGLW